MKKVKDYFKSSIKDIIGKKVRTKTGVIGYLIGVQGCVVLLNNVPSNEDIDYLYLIDVRLYPQVIMNELDLFEWDVIEDNRIFTNCADLLSLKYILNK